MVGGMAGGQCLSSLQITRIKWVYNQTMQRGPIIGFLLLVLAWPNTAQETYNSPEVASAGDAYVPYQVVLDGLFVLDVSLDATLGRCSALPRHPCASGNSGPRGNSSQHPERAGKRPPA